LECAGHPSADRSRGVQTEPPHRSCRRRHDEEERTGTPAVDAEQQETERAGDGGQRHEVEETFPEIDEDGRGHRHVTPAAQDDGTNGDLAEEEWREEQAQPGKVADVGIANRNPRLGAPEEKNPAQAAQPEADDRQAAGRGEPHPEPGRDDHRRSLDAA
jgi:hypothetical protein